MPSDAIGFAAPVPVLRIYDVGKAYEFYRDFLGFDLDWEHRFEPTLPLYAQISRSHVRLHLSAHHGDGTPGSVVWIAVDDIDTWQEELAAREYPYAKPGSPQDGPDGRSFEVIDPFGNVLRFAQSG